MTEIRLRAARPDEAGLLGPLALRSKGHWGYPAEFLAACRDELTVMAVDVDTGRITVAEVGGRLVGFSSVNGDPPVGELGDLWVEPDAIGTGIGRLLLRHALTQAGQAGFTRLHIEAEPAAEGFYLAMGAQRIGTVPSRSIPGRVLPLLEIHVPAMPG